MSNQKIGLVLSGGGGKGAYEVGVWKALEEFGIAEKISVISGTSVGALNAVLFAQHDSQVAEQVWKELGADDVLHINLEKIAGILSKIGMFFGGVQSKLLKTLIMKNTLESGIFSRKGLLRILDKYLGATSRVKVYAACTRLMPPCSDYFCINNLPHDNAVSALLASSAIPVVFGKVNVNGASYYDGGILDNTPVRPVYEEKCDVIITVFLNQTDLVSFEDYPDSKFLPIYPQEDLGGFFSGVLRFSNAEKTIEKGYQDAKKIIGPAYNLARTRFATEKCLQQIRLYNEEFQKYTVQNEKLLNEFANSIQIQKKSGRYQRRITMEDNTLVLVDNSVLSKTERAEINLYIDGIIEKYRQDSKALSRIALESASLITSAEARSGGMMGQGFFKCLWNGFTGKNHKLTASNQRDIAKAQYLSQQILNKLFEQNLVQFKMMVAIECKLNSLARDIFATNQNLLNVFHGEFSKMRAEMQDFRRNDELLFWKENIHCKKTFQEKSCDQLNVEQKIVCIANDFYTISKGIWNDRDLLFLKSVMQEVGLDPDETAIPADVLKLMMEEEALVQRFFRKTGYDVSTLPSENANTPFLTCLTKLEKLNGEENTATPTVFMSEVRLQKAIEYIRGLTGRNMTNSISCFDMVMELVSDLLMASFFIVSEEAGDIEKIEAAKPDNLVYVSGNDAEENEAVLNNSLLSQQKQKENDMKNTEKKASDIFSTLEKQGISVSQEQRTRIVKKMTEILNYEPIVGIFGKTGVGKSSLCNALFGKDIAEISDVAACTRNVQEIALNIESKGIKLLDVPGVGESRDRDEEYAELYKKLLPELDVVLWLLKGDDRAFSTDEVFYNKIVKPHLHDGKPFLIVLNQVDKIEPFREWDEKKNEPGLKQDKNIKDKIREVSRFFDLPESQIIPVSANEKYNLPSLVDDIVFKLPKDKKISFAKNVLGENVSESARSASVSALWDSVTDFLDDKVKQPIMNAVDKVKEFGANLWDSIRFWFW